MKPIKLIRNKCGDFWNPNDGKETYSRNIVELLDYLQIPYKLKDETEKKRKVNNNGIIN